MRNLINYQLKLVAALLILTIVFISNKAYSQEEKKDISLSIQYQKIINQHSLINISAKFKDENGFNPCAKQKFDVYKVTVAEGESGESQEEKIGETITNEEGKTKFIIPYKITTPSVSFIVRLENSKLFEDTEESVEALDANIEATIEEEDSVFYIKARLFLPDNQPLAAQSIEVGLARLFGNLKLGEEDSYETDEEGFVSVPIDEGLTGIDGKLTFRIALNESDEYGTIIAFIDSNKGEKIEDESTFDQRTMWSPPNKTPLFLWIFPNLILVSIWSILVFLTLNLFKIYKSNKTKKS
ncbi:MAG: hypothetical protein A2046_15005 [Bacteroidetes bacterium GWA2_30_7]|nr:MAG: hypothetical protein A2046_15005 [Bacteroidetes bacterium GWA2_30_7]